MNSEKLISNVLAGIMIAVMNITVAISVAALMFSGLPAQYLSPGIVVLLIGTVVVGLGGTFFSDFSGVICAPRSGLAPVFAAVVGGVYLAMGNADPASVMATVLTAIMTTSVLTGIFLIVLGRLKLGNLVRYIPYPVMGGFFAGIGFIFIKGGLTVATGSTPDLAMLSDASQLMLAVPAVFFAIALYLGLARIDHWATFPSILIVAFLVFYGVMILSGVSIDFLAEEGWFPVVDSGEGGAFPVVSISEMALVDWQAIFSESGGIMVIALLSAIILLLDTSGIEIITKRDLNPDKELGVMGVTNVASGLLGGYPGVHVASDTAFTFKLGGDGRIMGVVYALVVLITILMGTDFISMVPTFVLGGLLVYVGMDFLIDWLWKTRKDLPAADYFIIISILTVIALVDILEGVAFGCAIALVLFVVNYSRLSVIKGEANGCDHGSNIDRDLETREVLNEEGDRILIFVLQGFIFFGTSDKLISEIRDRVTHPGHHRLEYLLLDFHHVSQVDTSAIKAFARLAQLSELHGFHIVITGADKDSLDRLDQIEFMTHGDSDWEHVKFDEMDDGVAWCEDKVLTILERENTGSDRQLIDLLAMITSNEQEVNQLADFFKQETYQKDEYLFRQGDPGDCLYLVGSGSVAVVLELAGKQKVVRRYKAGTVIGEMALYTGEPRSASVILEDESVLYRLDRRQLDKLQNTNPSAASDIHDYIVRLLSERLSRANRELARYL